MPDLTPDQIDAMELLAGKATKGPWELCGGRDDAIVIAAGRKYDSVEQVRYDGSPVADCETHASCGVSDAEEESNALFIAACRDWVPSAIETMRHQAAEIERLRGLVKEAYIEGGGDLYVPWEKSEAKRALEGRGGSNAND